MSESNYIHKILFLNTLINVKMLLEYIYRYTYNIAFKMAATTFSMVAVYLRPLCAKIIVSLA